MTKYVFLKIEGTLLPFNGAISKQLLWKEDFNAEAIATLNLIVKDYDIKIICVGVPQFTPYATLSKKFSDAGFEYPENLIGQSIGLDGVTVSTPYDTLGLSPFPITEGNCIKYWVDNFLIAPYRLQPEEAVNYEIWERNTEGTCELEYKGMMELQEGKDFVYRLLGNFKGLIDEQIPKYIECRPEIGFNIEIAKKLVLSF